jgi:hypothetical protein
MSVSARFTTFIGNISLTDAQKTAGAERREAVVKALNQNYYTSNSRTDNSIYIGSWGKLTRVRPPRDVDVLFNLPRSVYDRFELRAGNKQSQLLQEVKTVLLRSFSNTAIRGDGPAVVVPFSAYNVELIPAFSLTSGQYWVCMTDNNGRYKTADYAAEQTSISSSNTITSGNTRDLVKMMKRWQAHCAVSLKSFWIEILAVQFLDQWQYAGKSATYYDWMCRDFLSFIINRANTYISAPGTFELMFLGDAWKSKATSALERAKKACDYEGSDNAKAGDEWQKIFGTDIPKYV